ncbi:5-oxoprolinase subunit PxpA [Vibrio ezurae]|uniref:LamB/YcsF family protein n=1 Tax=Vibrio ezurae NBRC 102218 TaxID=1219080 RepID=U3B3Q2_9VIBR|nr:5-oxoprolinase subunit PxpA [Vibrio ezurae]GAD80087.1 hypothetical protein VEZ01S_23_00390 [Vibrio ezurae NBRC 102218]
MKLNCDVGESFAAWSMGCDEQIMPYLDMANIACGFHASDPDIMSRTVALAKAHRVSIGAHPGYADLQGFGRRSIAHTTAQITHLVLYQVGALQGICHLHQTRVDYIKPHGALYNDMMKDIQLYDAILKAAHILNLPLMILATQRSDYLQRAQHMNVELIHEGFADRRYDACGQLTPRSHTDAVIEDIEQFSLQASAIIGKQPFKSIDNKNIQLFADSLCLHGDNPSVQRYAQRLRQLIDDHQQ